MWIVWLRDQETLWHSSLSYAGIRAVASVAPPRHGSYASRHLLLICPAGKWFLINIAHQFISSVCVCVWTGKLAWWMQCGNALHSSSVLGLPAWERYLERQTFERTTTSGLFFWIPDNLFINLGLFIIIVYKIIKLKQNKVSSTADKN